MTSAVSQEVEEDYPRLCRVGLWSGNGVGVGLPLALVEIKMTAGIVVPAVLIV